jgi:hypothetical protein
VHRGQQFEAESIRRVVCFERLPYGRVSDSAKIEALLLWLTLIRKLARDALPPEYIIDQPDLSPGQADAIAEEAKAISARAAAMAAQRGRRKEN